MAHSADLLPPLCDPRSLRYQPSAFGLAETRNAVSRYYQRRGLHVPADRIALTASTSEAYAYLFKLLMNPGDSVAVPTPSYPLFEHLAALESVVVRPYSLFYDGKWSVDPASVPEEAKTVVAVSPNNPTGSLADVPSLLEFGKPVIVDEVFSDYARSFVSSTELPVFCLNGLSKIAGLPQMKLGWIVFPETYRDALEWIADTYLSVSAPVQYAAIDWLDRAEELQAPIRERVFANERLLREVLRGTAATALTTDGGWTVPVEIPRVQPEEEFVCKLLTHFGVLAQPGYFYDFPRESFLIISLLTPPDVLARGLERLLEAIS